MISFQSQSQMVKLDVFLPTLSVKISESELPKMLRLKALRDAAIELCRESRFWRDDVLLYPSSAMSQYQLFTEDGVQFVELLKATQSGVDQDLDLSTDLQVVNPSTVVVSDDVLENGGTVTMTVALMPTKDAAMIADTVYQYCDDWIAAGAASRLYLMPKKEWFDAKLGTYYKQEFEDGKRAARRKALNEFTTYRNPTRKHTFF